MPLGREEALVLPPLSNRDLGDETEVEECEYHNVPLTWYDDGDPESGPHEPYLDCPQCREERLHPVLRCDVCGKDSRTLRTSVVNAYFDPTEAYHLECGHVVI
jgi:hypothetical protein